MGTVMMTFLSIMLTTVAILLIIQLWMRISDNKHRKSNVEVLAGILREALEEQKK